MEELHKLDNPVWHSLNETQRNYALDFNDLKCYKPDYCPFCGYVNGNAIADDIDAYAKLIDNFYIVGERPVFSQRLILKKELVCLQMVIGNRIDISSQEEIVYLNNGFASELLELVNLVQPGYFKSKTIMLGNYYGIFKNNRLVSVTGERMQMNGFTEVSAIVTHPDYTGKGYAKQLIAHAVNRIFDTGKIPFLHVAETNTGAIHLYEKLGFAERRKISFWNLSAKRRRARVFI